MRRAFNLEADEPQEPQEPQKRAEIAPRGGLEMVIKLPLGRYLIMTHEIDAWLKETPHLLPLLNDALVECSLG